MSENSIGLNPGEPPGGVFGALGRVAVDHHDQKLDELGKGPLESSPRLAEGEIGRDHVRGVGVHPEIADRVDPRGDRERDREQNHRPGVAARESGQRGDQPVEPGRGRARRWRR